MMTPKERMRAALKGERPDVAPAAPSYLALFREAVEKRQYVELYRERMRGIKRYRLDHDEDIEFRIQAFNAAYEIFPVMPDCIEVSTGPARQWAERTEILRDDCELWYSDTVTGEKRKMSTSDFPSGRDYLYEILPSADEPDVWDQSELIQSREVIDMLVRLAPLSELQEQGVFDLPRRIASDIGREYFIMLYDSTPYTASYLLGFQGMMTAFYDNPDNLRYFIKRVLEQRMPILKGYAESGCDGMYVEEIFSGADIISPELYDQFVYSGNERYFRAAKEAGLLTTYYICGNPLPLLDRINRLECSAVAVEEGKKNFEIPIEQVVEALGKNKCIWGNIDAVAFGLQAQPEQVRAEVIRQIEAGRKAKGFIVSTGSPLPLHSQMQNIKQLIEAAHTYKFC
jgi:uroporphyrinogen-III decarboxylase